MEIIFSFGLGLIALTVLTLGLSWLFALVFRIGWLAEISLLLNGIMALVTMLWLVVGLWCGLISFITNG